MNERVKREVLEALDREPLSSDEVRHFNVMQWIAVAVLIELVAAYLLLRLVIGG